MKSKVLFKVYLDSSSHKRTGFATHSRDGILIEQLPYYLQIENNPLVKGEYYLIHYNEHDEEISDTLHDGISEAMEQALLEFKIKENEWMKML